MTTLPVHERIRRGLRRTYQISQLFGGLTFSTASISPVAAFPAGRFRSLRPRADDALMMQAESIIQRSS